MNRTGDPHQVIYICTDRGECESADIDVTEMMTFHVDLSSVTSVRDLLGVVGRELLFPHDASGFDDLLDLLSDLDWFRHEGGYVVRLRGIGQLGVEHADLLDDFLALIPFACDRWRSRRGRFVVLIECTKEDLPHVREPLDRANAELSTVRWRHGLADHQPVEVRECSEP